MNPLITFILEKRRGTLSPTVLQVFDAAFIIVHHSRAKNNLIQVHVVRSMGTSLTPLLESGTLSFHSNHGYGWNADSNLSDPSDPSDPSDLVYLPDAS